MADEEDIGALQRVLAKQKALVAQTEAKIAAAKAAAQAAAQAPAAAAPAPLPAPKSTKVIRPPPSLKAPEAHAGAIYTDKGREAGLFTATHREQAAIHKSLRDHAAWDRFYDPGTGRFVSKKRKIGAHKQYHLLLKSGVISPPRGHYFNTLTNEFKEADSVFTKKGVLRAALAHMRVKGGLLMERGREVTVTCILFFPMTYEDDQGHEHSMTKAIFEQRRDVRLAYVMDPDGYYHQEEREMVLNTTEEALAPWLPAGRTWWVKGAHFPDYVPLDTIKEAPIGLATSVRAHTYGTLATALSTFSSSLSAIQFRSVTVHPDAPYLDPLSLPHHGKPRLFNSRFLETTANPAATRLEDWIVPRDTNHFPTEGGQVVQMVLPPDTGCGYEFIINTFSKSFAKHQATVEVGRKKSRYADVEMTPKWLYEHIFHPGQAYDEEDLGLSLRQLGLFFKHFCLSLFVLDITGRLVEDASVLFWARKDIKANPSMDQEVEALDEHITPVCSYILAHNEHIYPIMDKTMTERLRQFCWNANSFVWRPIQGLGKEADGEEAEEEVEKAAAPSGRYSLGNDEAPVIFLPNIDALATLNVRQPKLDKKGVPKTHAKTGTPLLHERLRIAVPASMNITLVELVERANYEPRVTVSGLGELLSLTIKVDGVSLSISAPHHLVPEPAENDRMPWLPTEAIYQLYCEHDAALKASLRTISTLSHYSKSLEAVFKRRNYNIDDGRFFSVTPFYRSPLYYGTAYEGPVTAVDRTKSYTSLLMEMDKVPVFTEFCDFEPLDYAKPVSYPQQVSEEPLFYASDTLSQCSDPTDTPRPFKQVPSAEEAHAGGAAEARDPNALRAYTDKSLGDIVRSLRQQGSSDSDIKAILTGDLEQPHWRAGRFLHSERERHSFYLVMRSGTLFEDDPKHLILDQPYCLLTFGTWLLCRDWDCCHTLAIIKPFNLVKTDIVKVIKAMWDSALPTHLKKFLPNKHVGICGKSDNRSSKTLLFTSAVEANNYRERTEDASMMVRRLGKHTYHFVTQEWRTPLSDGFMPIHYAVLDAQRRVLYEKAVEVGLPVLGVKTDCLFFAGHDPAKDVPKVGTFEAIGSWHTELAKEHPTKPHFERQINESWLPKYLNYEPEVATLPVFNEFDTSELASIFSTTNNVLVLADIPGAGKTYALKSYMATLGEAALFVTPYNALADDLVKGDNPAHQAITFHRLLGLGAKGEEAEEEDMEDDAGKKKRKKGHDITGISHIVFDEVFCYTPPMLGHLKRFMDQNATMDDGTERHFYAAGDANQNAPINPSSLTRLELKAYYTRAISFLFPNQIRLKVCKRVSGEEQQARIVAIKEAVLNTDEPLLDICHRYFKPINKLSQVRGRAVCYTNESARCVNDYREQRIAKSLEEMGQEVVRFEGRVYYVGQTLRCRIYHRTPRIYINYTYIVSGFERKGGVVTGTCLEETKAWPWALSLVKKLFIYDHANTCHSLQGMSAEGGISLFDVDAWCVSREWVYTALTRTTDLDAVFFWDPAAGTVSGLPVVLRSDFRQAMETKLAGYMAQDTAAGRTWAPEDYIDGDAIMTLHAAQDGRCAYCADSLPPRWKAADRNQPTVDRLDNALAHIKGNCCLACLRCNTTRH